MDAFVNTVAPAKIEPDSKAQASVVVTTPPAAPVLPPVNEPSATVAPPVSETPVEAPVTYTIVVEDLVKDSNKDAEKTISEFDDKYKTPDLVEETVIRAKTNEMSIEKVCFLIFLFV